MGKHSHAGILMGEATRMSHLLGLHKVVPREGLNCVEIQLYRRAYWFIYTSDKRVVVG